MINLLPYDYKREIRAGRVNVILTRYIAMLLSATALLAVLIGGAYVVLNATQETAQVKVNANQSNMSSYAQTQAQAEAFRADLATAKTIFDKEVTYSKLIYKIADVIPPNVILESISLDPQKFGSSATMNASAKSFSDAIKLKQTLIKNSDIFTDVSFDAVNNGGSSAGGSYPVSVNLKVTIKKEASL